MVRDILIDIDSNDIQISENIDKNSLIFDTIWGDLFDGDRDDNIVYLNVIVPSNYIQYLNYDTDGKFQCNIKADYYPNVSNFYVRFVTCVNNVYNKVDNKQLPDLSQAKAYNYGLSSLIDLVPSQLILINDDGYYTLLFRKEVVYNIPNVEVYSMSEDDLTLGSSDDQSAKLLAVCASGKNYRYPTTGVGITDYINCVIENSNLNKALIDEFEKNMTPVKDAEFDSATGALNVSQSSELEQDFATTIDKDELDMSIVSITDDEHIRSLATTVIDSDVNYFDFLNDIAERDDIFRIYGLESAKQIVLNDTNKTDIGYSFVKDGSVGHYSEVSKPGYMVVTAVLKKNDIVRFRLSDDVPVVFMTETNSISEREDFNTKWVELLNKDEYGSCGIIKKECYIHYCIKTDKFKSNNVGVFKLDINGNALQDLLVIVRDNHTSRLLGYVTTNSNILNVHMHKITGQIFLTKMIDNE